MEVKKTGKTEEVHSIEFTYKELIALLDMPDGVHVDISTKGLNSVLTSPLGTLRSPTQKLIVSVTRTNKF